MENFCEIKKGDWLRVLVVWLMLKYYLCQVIFFPHPTLECDFGMRNDMELVVLVTCGVDVYERCNVSVAILSLALPCSSVLNTTFHWKTCVTTYRNAWHCHFVSWPCVIEYTTHLVAFHLQTWRNGIWIQRSIIPKHLFNFIYLLPFKILVSHFFLCRIWARAISKLKQFNVLLWN